LPWALYKSGMLCAKILHHTEGTGMEQRFMSDCITAASERYSFNFSEWFQH